MKVRPTPARSGAKQRPQQSEDAERERAAKGGMAKKFRPKSVRVPSFARQKYGTQRDVFKTLRSFRRRIASSMSNSVMQVKLKPSLSQAFGNMLIAVKPGIELISLR